MIDPAEIERNITPRTKALVVVDYAVHPVALRQISELAEKHGLAVIEDACHALGAPISRAWRIGGLSTLTAFSFHPVKHITTAEGGMVTTNEPRLADKLPVVFAIMASAAIIASAKKVGSWFYEDGRLGIQLSLERSAVRAGTKPAQETGSMARAAPWPIAAREYDAAGLARPPSALLSVMGGAGNTPTTFTSFSST